MDRTHCAALFPYTGAKGESFRRPTIREAFLLMGFTEEEYERTEYLQYSYRKMNKLIGNSIVVNVLEEIFRAMFENKFYQAAKEYLDKSKDVFYNDPELHFLYAKYYTRFKDYEKADYHLDECLNILNDYLEMLHQENIMKNIIKVTINEIKIIFLYLIFIFFLLINL